MVKRSRLSRKRLPDSIRKYVNEYTEFTSASVLKALDAVKKFNGRLDAITVDYYLKPKKYGGLGMGKARY